MRGHWLSRVFTVLNVVGREACRSVFAAGPNRLQLDRKSFQLDTRNIFVAVESGKDSEEDVSKHWNINNINYIFILNVNICLMDISLLFTLSLISSSLLFTITTFRLLSYRIFRVDAVHAHPKKLVQKCYVYATSFPDEWLKMASRRRTLSVLKRGSIILRNSWTDTTE